MYTIIGADQKEYGPITAEQVRQWISEGRLNASSRIRVEGSIEWKSISQLAEFVGTVPQQIHLPPSTPVRRTNGLAIASLIFGIISLPGCCCPVFSPVGIIMGVVALSQVRHSPGQDGRGLAIAGIVLSAIGLVFFGLFWIVNGAAQLAQFQQLLKNQ